MADHVIHGTGKPRFVIPTETIHTNTVSSATSTTVVLTTTPSPTLDQLNESYGLLNAIVYTKNSSGAETTGKITAFVHSTKTLTVESWDNSTPNATAALSIKNKRIDLPYCQRLTESFSPDFIEKKMINGELVQIKRGFYYQASLDYARYLHKDEMELLRDLYNKNTNYIFFTPRVDNLAVFYTVLIDPDSAISFYQLQNHQGHGGVVINVKSRYRIDKIPFIDPTQATTKRVGDDTDAYVMDDLQQSVTGD